MGNKQQCCRNPQQPTGDVVLTPINYGSPNMERGQEILLQFDNEVIDRPESNYEVEIEEKELPTSKMDPSAQMKDKFNDENHRTGEGTHNPQQPGIVQLSELPNVKNKGIDYISKIRGAFEFNRDRPEDAQLPFLPPYKLEKGEAYKGQWKNGLKHGKGVQVWPNNAVYYGYWKDGMANGFGRLVHVDGDVYEG